MVKMERRDSEMKEEKEESAYGFLCYELCVRERLHFFPFIRFDET